LEQLERLDVEFFGEAFHDAQARVAFAAFEPADVGAVDVEQLGELFLGQLTLDAKTTQVAPQSLLQHPDHRMI
jgi:hypothetical protein